MPIIFKWKIYNKWKKYALIVTVFKLLFHVSFWLETMKIYIFKCILSGPSDVSGQALLYGYQVFLLIRHRPCPLIKWGMILFLAFWTPCGRNEKRRCLSPKKKKKKEITKERKWSESKLSKINDWENKQTESNFFIKLPSFNYSNWVPNVLNIFE